MLTFIETKLFTSLVKQYLVDDEYADLQRALVAKPDAGDLIRGSGGVRVIFYLRSHQAEMWMLTVYAKNEEANIPGHVLKQIKEEIDGGV